MQSVIVSDIWPTYSYKDYSFENGDGVVNEDKNTLYSYTSVMPSVLQTIQNGLAKRVKGNSGMYVKDDLTGLGEE